MHRNKSKLIQGIQTYHVVASQRANRERQFPDIAMPANSLKKNIQNFLKIFSETQHHRMTINEIKA